MGIKGKGNQEIQRHEFLIPSPKLVGMTGLEPATTRPPDVYANQLRYIPIDAPNRLLRFSDCKISHFF